jgi:hypothetical protein
MLSLVTLSDIVRKYTNTDSTDSLLLVSTLILIDYRGQVH